MFGRHIRTKFDLLIPNTSKEMTPKKTIKGKNRSQFTPFQLGQ